MKRLKCHWFVVVFRRVKGGMRAATERAGERPRLVLRLFDVEKMQKMRLASVMGICAGLVGQKCEKVEKTIGFIAIF